ncbi:MULTISPECIES: excinuclease ABC subunit UvrC [Halomonadaceae]|jgi:excinuclease ABC subunit C|uniref:UvrABC system protein C n=2 Tax=Vreelandella titanicae TaxID=664683 RepID=L9U7N9_9GAMM|nr:MULTISPECIES: excinuclease ABC subunit UvrC [Halomonas]UEQ02471.1 excinuclease ABC subunit UvrC [Halomonas profundus]ELY20807.1 Excinuclease ABC, C subunit [Halomonas titanicae BH1]KIN13529.1 excinuclease ABC subunit C [Halomonas sp. KHS3]MCE7520904.1 excinuclease ABC subunit UvrC [Halomonas titanicae]NVE92666.1 excinuclease ABC subunit UvrC [Halomonas titanicae]|tara:strand:+ start:4302 stop:6116 length:1815 start_codon:yes stop_codon:yes gene_type:complete
MTFDSKQFLSSVSSSPGVYRMLDEQSNTLYVGKAKRLKARLASYFRGQLNTKTQAMVGRIADVQVTVTRTETEALLLEQTLIKQLRPPYNILLRDDKSYPFVFVTDRHPYPALEYKRARQRSDDGRYLGPYPSSGAVRESLALMQKIFHIRNCEDSVFAHRSRPCLQYQIHRCSAPCVDYISAEDYRRDLEHAVMCLEGKSESVTQELMEAMEKASQALNFEEAARLRDQVQQLRQLQQRQFVDTGGGDADIFALAQRPGALGVSVLSVRDGRLLGARHHTPKNDLDLPLETLLTEVVSQYYFGQPHNVPSEVITSHPLDDSELIAEALTQQAGKRIRVTSQVRGHRAQWQQLAITNAEQQLASQLANQTQLTQRFTALQKALGLADTPQRLECFDISHSHGEATVASCVVFDHQGPRKSDYRHFRIEGVAAGDDYAAMQQALTRRLKRVKSGEAVAPDILIVDGGKGQLNMAREVFKELDIVNIILLGVAKGTTRKAGLESLFVETADNPLDLDPASPALHLIQHIRDESHRFAIAGHRAQRDKARRTSTLQDIPGIGPKRRRELLRFFGGLQGVQKASRDELARVPGINASLAESIYRALNG